MKKTSFFFIGACFMIVIMIGCSNTRSPLIPSNGTELRDYAPLEIYQLSENIQGVTGIMGAYNLTIDPDTQTVDLVPKRNLDLGQSYLVNGKSFFVTAPCEDCFTIRSITWGATGIKVTFNLVHPFPKGNTSNPPSAKNRLDLDVFDMALLIRPLNVTPENYSLLDRTAYLGYLINQDGFTSELSNLLIDEAAIPYYLVIDDTDTGLKTWNKFEMGADVDFDVNFMRVNDLEFELYLTMGYGWSATFQTRFDPLYFNPEYNKKAAWKVEAEALGYWTDSDNTTPVNVQVRVYDWQAGATVYADPDDFRNAPLDNVYASSEVQRVYVEIPGMTNTISSVTTPVSGTGKPGDPLVFNVPLINENLITGGIYTGLVKVQDGRPCLTPVEGRDFLVDSPDGVSFDYYSMNEYATYQIFKATVAGNTGWVRTWGDTQYDYAWKVAVDAEGYIYVTGNFRGTVDFDPDPDREEIQVVGDNYGGYLCKYDPGGRFLWVRTLVGEGIYIETEGMEIDSEGKIFISGTFAGTVDFNPDPVDTDNRTSAAYIDTFLSLFNVDGDYLSTLTIGGPLDEYNYCLEMDEFGNTYLGGYFSETVDFDPGTGVAECTSNGLSDTYLCSFDNSGIFRWVQSWGGAGHDNVGAIAVSPLNDQVVTTGRFEETVDFDPSVIGDDSRTSIGEWDLYYSLFDNEGTWIKSRTWGGLSQDLGMAAAFDPLGNFYLGGYFRETADFNPGPGIDTHISQGMKECFVSKFDSTGSFIWAYTWGGEYDDEVRCITFDTVGNFYVGGEYSDIVDFDPSGNSTLIWGNNSDGFVSKFDSVGTFQWVSAFGSNQSDEIISIATFGSESVYAAGYFGGMVDFDPSWDTLETFSHGSNDAFLWKLLPNGQWE